MPQAHDRGGVDFGGFNRYGPAFRATMFRVPGWSRREPQRAPDEEG